MNDRVKLVIGIGLLAPLFMVALVAAQETTTTEQQTTTEQTQTQKDQLRERIEKRKTELKTKLTAAQQTRVKARCKAAQGLASSVSSNAKKAGDNRVAQYDNTVARLTELSEKLQNKGVITTQLDSQIAELTAKVNTFKADLVTYQQAVSDLAILDCTTDPIAFQASLDAARSARQKTAVSSQAVKAYLKDTIKVSLAQLRTQVSDGGATSGGTQ